jgi:hypothetical protein
MLSFVSYTYENVKTSFIKLQKRQQFDTHILRGTCILYQNIFGYTSLLKMCSSALN